MAYPNKNNGFLFLWTIPVSLFLLAKPRDGVRTNMADSRRKCRRIRSANRPGAGQQLEVRGGRGDGDKRTVICSSFNTAGI